MLSCVTSVFFLDVPISTDYCKNYSQNKRLPALLIEVFCWTGGAILNYVTSPHGSSQGLPTLTNGRFLLQRELPAGLSLERVLHSLHRRQPRAPRSECLSRHWCHDREPRHIVDRPIHVCPALKSQAHACSYGRC